MFKRITFLLAITVAHTVFSQGSKEKDYLATGDRYFNKGDIENALLNYKLAYRQNAQDPKVNLRLGQAYLSGHNKFRALEYIEQAYRLKPDIDPDIDYYLGTAAQINFHFRKAIKHFEVYKNKNKKLATIADHKIQECKLGDSLMIHPLPVTIRVLDWPVNSPYQDYGPLLNRDQTLLVFTSARDTNEVDTRFERTFFEDILSSEYKHGKWTTPKEISSNINEPFHDAASSLTADGRTLVYYNEKGNGDLYVSNFDGKDWSKPIPMGPNINSDFWETSGCFSPDGKRFFFTSDRPGGSGDLDLYVSEKLPNGEWGKAVNLGPGVNSPGHEDAPFMHADGTLYFGSDGHFGMGSYDIFRTAERNGKWQTAVNVGYPINTPDYENFFYLSDDKKIAYFSSVRNEGIGLTDLCLATFYELPSIEESIASFGEEMKEIADTPPPALAEDEFVSAMVTFQKDLGIASDLVGTVMDEESAVPLRAQVILINNETNEVVSRIYSDRVTGKFRLTIPHGGNYGINTQVDGYLFNSLNFEVPAFQEYQEIETAILMVKVKVGSKAVLKNIFFDTGKADLKEESISELNRLVDLMEKNPLLKIQINGHTDNTGDAGTNKTLSLKRAQSVVSYMVNKGVVKERLHAVGFGEERPIVSNDDEAGGREINRRTEMEVTETVQAN